MLTNFFYLVFGTIVLIAAGLDNGYPLTFADSGTYIRSGFTLEKPIDKPITYGLFIRLASLQYSAWLVIFFQSLLLSFIIFQTFKTFFENPAANNLSLISIILLSFLTGISWYASQIMPDIFISTCLMVLAILLFTERIPARKMFFLSLVLLLSNMVHYSHLMISVILMLFYSLAYISLSKYINFKMKKSRLLFVWSIIIASWLILPTVHYFCGAGFKISDSSHVTLMGRLAENGILRKYLDETCQTQNYQICRYRNSLPNNADAFIWKDSSPLYKTGGWYANQEEYKEIIKDTIVKPRFLMLNVSEAMKATLKLLTQNAVGAELIPNPQGSYVHKQIQNFFENELNEYTMSRQNTSRLNLNTLNIIQYFVLGFSFICMVVFFVSGVFKVVETRLMLFAAFLSAGIILNAAVTASFSGVYDRYESRTIWLLPMIVLIIIFGNYKSLRHGLRKLFE